MPAADIGAVGDERRKKRIILLLDGTWNDSAVGDNDTNIVRLEDLIVRTLRESGSQTTATTAGKLTHGYVTDGQENIVLYQRGVGTGAFDRFKGGTLGVGLHDNIRRAYKFVSYHYEPGCDLYIFGFSRGAYTARSLVGYIGASGLLTRANCSQENEALAWSNYRTPPADRIPATSVQLDGLVHDRREVRVKCLGVFDTVGALGVPFGAWFSKLNREKYGFHDVELSSITEVNLHAMAVDEHRKPFSAAVWRSPRFKKMKGRIEQVWFPGAHADIGGGYVSAERRRSDPTLTSLDDITLDWMLKRLAVLCPDFPIDRAKARWRAADSSFSRLNHHDERKLVYKLFRFAWRALANRPIANPGWRQVAVSYDRRDTTIGEAIHISLLERLNQEITVDGRKRTYAPRNLLEIIEIVRQTYTSRTLESPIRIVDWSGDILDPDIPADAEKALAAIESAVPTS
jgi:uncharacterized protein (DUF2235 family)